jgi:hypothetical protein
MNRIIRSACFRATKGHKEAYKNLCAFLRLKSGSEAADGPGAVGGEFVEDAIV